MAPSKDYALAIVIEGEEGRRVEEIRRRWDKSVEKWPPHINLLWPFPALPSGGKDLHRLVPLLPPSFTVTLGPLRPPSSSSKKKSKGPCSNLYISPSLSSDPEGAMERIVEVVREQVAGAGECERREMHCTLGQIREDEFEEVAAMWEPMSFRVEALDLLSLRSGSMKSLCRIYLL
eukprot:TRINITY_DN2854_c0_g1_i1.p1 TRINITY_DN2854_c0_g1~~TRINITY_DN2854_c0_g1_i1.p1  ORF type:complete len:176 (-),score=42.25 TRINITY_DN2854_c0_g1_i1:287-814(-)